MAKINVLDQRTINQIAAGEVIERPSSIVKELLENAIDAKASAITVEIKDGGISFIRITDNGTGIDKDDIPVAFLRHSTSKIKDAIDLMTVSSLGFRGEALSSIAAIAMVELITKTNDALCGTRYVIEGGVEKSIEEIGVPNGTTFIIRNIFFNTPARRKFLKTAATEGSYISDIVERIALSHPEISIRFICNNQNKLHTSGNGSLKDVIYAIYGKDITSNIIEVNEQIDQVKLTGYIGKPVINRGNRTYENYFINGRYIKSGFVYKAIEDAYSSFMMQHKYPFTALNIEINQELIDVNVHPTKMELRFRNQEVIYPFICKAIKDGLLHKEMIPDVVLSDKKKEPVKVIETTTSKAIVENVNIPIADNSNKVVAENISKTIADNSNKVVAENICKTVVDNIVKPKEEEVVKTKEEQFVNPKVKPIVDNKVEKIDLPKEEKATEVKNEQVIQKKINSTRVPEPFETKRSEEYIKADEERVKKETSDMVRETPKGYQMELFDDKLLSKKARESHRIVGQVFETYWIVEFGDKMFLIDQHAAHEKVLYERLVKRYKNRENISQELNPPIIVSLTMREEELLLKHMNLFNELGYELESLGGVEYAIRAVPYDLLSLSDKDVFIEILDGIVSNENSKITSETLLDRMATMSCKAAVKGNNKLSYREANELIDELLELENPYHCPHGRPTIVSMSKYELERKFKRII